MKSFILVIKVLIGTKNFNKNSFFYDVQSKNTEDLERKMEKLTVDSNSEEQKTPESSIGKALKSFMHASECEEVDCAFPNCVNMKVKVSHIRRCKKRAVNGCKTCQKVMELYFKHAENCELDECSVPFCLNIRKR